MELGPGLARGEVDGLPFVKVLGSSPKVGKGTLYTYTVYIEAGTRVRRRAFARTIESILGDPRSWIKGGKVAFQRVESGASTHCVLALPDTVDKLCAPLDTDGEVSCCVDRKVVLNYDRWKYAVPHWTGGIASYRKMVVNHEFGHRIGQPHRWCPEPGAPAPCMQQQTYGMQGCKCNCWPLASEL